MHAAARSLPAGDMVAVVHSQSWASDHQSYRLRPSRPFLWRLLVWACAPFEPGKIRVAETETRPISKSLGYTLFTQILLFLHDPFMLGTEKLLFFASDGEVTCY